MSQPNVMLITLGRGASGETARLTSWRSVYEEAGASVTTLRLLDHHSRLRDAHRLPDVIAGRAVPESLTWSEADARLALERLSPQLAIVVTSRAWSPRFGSRRRVILDYVDRLSVSYRQRGALHPKFRLPYELLAKSHRRFEQAEIGVATVAAGWSDARALGAAWVPVVVEARPLPPVSSAPHAHDVVFFGSLSYPPNVDAVLQLATLAPDHWRVLIAGRTPHRNVLEAVARRGWVLEEDYPDVATLARRARVAVVPLRATAGIQIKVLEAASNGLPQVVTDSSLAGMAPGFPAQVRPLGPEFAIAVEALLSDDDSWMEQRQRSFDHVQERYVAAAWAQWAQRSFENGQ